MNEYLNKSALIHIAVFVGIVILSVLLFEALSNGEVDSQDTNVPTDAEEQGA